MPTDLSPAVEPAAPSSAEAFAALLLALRSDGLAPGADYERIRSYLAAVERMAERYAAGATLREPRAAKAGG